MIEEFLPNAKWQNVHKVHVIELFGQNLSINEIINMRQNVNMTKSKMI